MAFQPFCKEWICFRSSPRLQRKRSTLFLPLPQQVTRRTMSSNRRNQVGMARKILLAKFQVGRQSWVQKCLPIEFPLLSQKIKMCRNCRAWLTRTWRPRAAASPASSPPTAAATAAAATSTTRRLPSAMGSHPRPQRGTMSPQTPLRTRTMIR